MADLGAAIRGLVTLCRSKGIHAIPVESAGTEQVLEVFYPTERLEKWISATVEAYLAPRYPFRQNPVSSATVENIAVYQAFQRLTTEFGIDVVRQHITSALDEQWEQYSSGLWETLKARIGTEPVHKDSATKAAQADEDGQRATKSQSKPKIGVLWCSWFAGNWWSRPWRLRYAYRPPSLFASKMRGAGYDIEVMSCDEKVELAHLDGTKSFIQDDVEILYVMTHGDFQSGGYHAELNSSKWFPATSGLGSSSSSRLSVVIFDTCNLLDTSQSWQAKWAQNLGKSVRLILGFEGNVAIDQGSALRGYAFACELVDNNRTFAEAWLLAAQNSMTHLTSSKKAVAFGVGNSSSDAKAVLNTATLSNMPPARSSSTVVLELK
jgi:hypothetical protein